MMLIPVYQFIIYSAIVAFTSAGSDTVFRSFVIRVDELSQTIRDQKQVIEEQKRMIESFNKSQTKVFFTAKLDTSPFVHDRIIFDTVVTNEGQGYHSDSVWFNAPVNGTYFFIVTIANNDDNDSAEATLTMNGNVQTIAKAHQGESKQTCVCSLVVQLVEQDEVLVRAEPEWFRAELTTFSGYLIHADP